MIKFIIVILFFLLFFIKNVKRKNGIYNSSSFLFAIYLLVIVSSVPYMLICDEKLAMEPRYFDEAIYFLLLLLLFLSPIYWYKENKIEKIVLPNYKILQFFSYLIIFLSFFSILFFSSSVNKVFSMDLGDARNQLYGGDIYVEVGFANTIASVSASMYIFAIMLFFIFLIIGNKKKMCVLLFLSSFSYIFNSLAYAGRDGVVFWIFSYLYIYLFFKDFISYKIRKKINRYFIITVLLLMIPFVMISMGRFSDMIGEYILSYIGQSFPNFCLYLGIEDYPTSPGGIFPLFRKLIGLPELESISWSEGGTVSWVFGTFLKSFISSLYLWGTILIGLIICGFFYVYFHNTKHIFKFHKIFIYLLYFQILSQGVFYFRHYTRGGNLFIIICLLFALLFKYLYNNKNNITLKKYEKH